MKEAKCKVTITIDADLLRRIDAVADDLNESRSAVMNRMFRNGIKDEEEFTRDMENPVARALLAAMTSTPGVMESIAVMVGKQMTKEQSAELKQYLKGQAQRGKQRKASKKATRKKGPTPHPA